MSARFVHLTATLVLFLLSGCMEFYAPPDERPAPSMPAFEGELPSTVSGAGWVVSDSPSGAVFADPLGIIAEFPGGLGESNHTVLSDRSILVWTPDTLRVFDGQAWDTFEAHTIAGLARAAITNVVAWRSSNIVVDLIDLDTRNRHTICGLRGACVASDAQGYLAATTSLIWTVSGSQVQARRPSENLTTQRFEIPEDSTAIYPLVGDRVAVRSGNDLYLIEGFSNPSSTLPVQLTIPNTARQGNGGTWGSSDLFSFNGRLLKGHIETEWREVCSPRQWGIGCERRQEIAAQTLIVSEVVQDQLVEIGQARLIYGGGWSVTLSTYGEEIVVTTGPSEIPLRFVVPGGTSP